MQAFQKINNIVGWAIFAIATLVYVLTVERTASFWDCGEFIACSYLLQVPHPPGAPFFLLVNRMFSFLAMGDVTQVAYWINISSALCSSFTILFLFWSIVMLGLKMYPKDAPIDAHKTWTLMASAAIGSLAYTFSDSFWFSAVEAEVYAMSSFFTAFVIWAALKWDRIEDARRENQWLILIAYTTGLSIGVHLLNLVTLPALALIYYYKKYPKPNIWGTFVSLLIGLFIVVLVMYGVIPGLPTLAGHFEIFFVNSLGLGFGSGVVFFLVLFLGALSAATYYSVLKQKELLNTALLSFIFILIGYTSYAIVLVRSQYNTPINENDPSDLIRFVSYLKREQYGDRPLLYGPIYTSEPTEMVQGAPIYRMVKEKGKYEIYSYKTSYKYDKNILLPRIYSDEHKALYEEMLNLREGQSPTMYHNLKFMFSHQLGHMYFRYFLWNFAGRAGDEEGSGWLAPWEAKKGKDVPEDLARNKARNQFYMLPLILGILGMIYQLRRNERMFFFTMMVFVMTGIALVVYLNSPPVEPRERDYIYVGSFYAFAMWIGFGVMLLADWFQSLQRNKQVVPGFALAFLLTLPVPTLMATEGWDDHDRSNRYHSVDFARNMLESCAPNAILFTGGDNDTFPLWYLQDVEGVRRDVRICNLSLLGTDWYIQQMKRPTYASQALPISLNYENFIQGKNEQVLFYPDNNNFSKEQRQSFKENGIDLDGYLKAVKNNDQRIAFQTERSTLNTLPTKRLVIKIDKKAILSKGLIQKDLEPLLEDYMVWDLEEDRNRLFKHDLIILDLIAQINKAGWDRPIYFASILTASSYLNLREFMQQEGLAYRLLPVKVPGAKQGYISSEKMYENMIKKFKYRQMDNPNVYYSDTYRSFPLNLRTSFYRLANQFLLEENPQKAKEVIDFCLKVIPDKANPYDYYTPLLADVLLKLGEKDKAMEILTTMGKRAEQNLKYTLDKGKLDATDRVQLNFAVLNQIARIMEDNKLPEYAYYEKVLQNCYNQISK